jgi:hypothetical protein
MSPSLSPRPDRRTAIKWMLTAAASTAVLGRTSYSAEAAALLAPPPLPPISAAGYGTDPDITKNYRPGDVWPLTFTDAQRTTAAALCAIIIPREVNSPSAAELNVHDFIDEWISAPYPDQALDRPLILEGLAWIEAEAQRRFSREFPKLSGPEHVALCDDICFASNAAPVFARAAKFFARFRDLTASGFYTTPQGAKDLGYLGNIPLATFDGPPPEVLRKLGLI